MLNEKPISVLVTGVGGGGVGEQIIFALRLSKYPYRIITVDHDPFNLCLYSMDKSYLVPSATEKSYLNKLLEICKKESVKVLIPGSEIELSIISKSRDLFKNENILLLINSKDVIELCQNKWTTYLFLKNNGFSIPESYLWDECNNINNLDYPVIVKPYLESGGSRLVFIAQNNEELSFFCRYLKRQGSNPMVQKYVGSYENEYTIEVLTSYEGDILGSIAINRRIQGRLSTLYRLKNYYNNDPLCISSGISQGFIDDFPDIREIAEKIAEKINSKGPINIQCRVTENGISVFEINPRFSGTESLRALAGFNAPDSLIRKYILGEDIKRLKYKKGFVSRGLHNNFTNYEEYNRIKLLNKNNF
jgi:carbamoyl-phosphate synthase large subunit